MIPRTESSSLVKLCLLDMLLDWGFVLPVSLSELDQAFWPEASDRGAVLNSVSGLLGEPGWSLLKELVKQGFSERRQSLALLKVFAWWKLLWPTLWRLVPSFLNGKVDAFPGLKQSWQDLQWEPCVVGMQCTDCALCSIAPYPWSVLSLSSGFAKSSAVEVKAEKECLFLLRSAPYKLSSEQYLYVETQGFKVSLWSPMRFCKLLPR